MPKSSDFLKPADVAKYLGIGKATVYTAIKNGDLWAGQYGSVFRIRWGDALDWHYRGCLRRPVDPDQRAEVVAQLVTAMKANTASGQLRFRVSRSS